MTIETENVIHVQRIVYCQFTDAGRVKTRSLQSGLFERLTCDLQNLCIWIQCGFEHFTYKAFVSACCFPDDLHVKKVKKQATERYPCLNNVKDSKANVFFRHFTCETPTHLKSQSHTDATFHI